MPPRRDAPAPVRRFFLSATPDSGPACISDDELHHALHVTRLEVGDRLEGLDGRGASYPLEVTRASRTSLELQPTGEPRREPAPGEPGSGLPAFEVCVSFPKANRAEALIDRLTQLGAARVRPLVTARTPAHGREPARMKGERLARVAREACKQSGRLWLPVIDPPVAFEDALAESGRAVLLDPTSATRLCDLAAAHPPPERLLVGPEGGFDDEERAAAERRGVQTARIGCHVLRTETAAEAGLAMLVGHAR